MAGKLKRLGTMLKNINLKELSLVRAGANQHADVVLVKSADEETPETPVEKDLGVGDVHVDNAGGKDKVEKTACPKCKTMVASGAAACPSCKTPIKKADDEYSVADAGVEYAGVLRDSLVAALEKADTPEEAFDDMSDILETVAKTLPELVAAGLAKEREATGAGPAPSGTPDAGATGDPIHKEHNVADAPKVEDVLKGLTPEAQEFVKSLASTVEKQNEQLTAIAKAELRKSVEKNIGVIGVETDKIVKLYEQVDAEGRATLDDILTKANTFAKDAKAFEEVGTTSAATAGADGELKKAVADLRKADPKMTEAQAIRKALELNPELYDELDNSQAE